MKLNIGAVIGLVAALIGGGVAIFSVMFTDPMVLFVIVPVLLLVFFIFFRAFVKPAMDYNKLLKGGLRGTGTILSISETGTRINNQPLCKIELSIQAPGQVPYNATTKTVISYFQASMFQPGAQVPVMIDPANKMKVLLMSKEDADKENNPLINASPQQMDELKQKLEDLQRENDQIKAIGIYCKAIVTKYTNMGVNVNGNNPLATIEVQVLPENEPAFGATVKGAIKETSVPLFQPGEEIYVKYDPNDKTKVTIEHS